MKIKETQKNLISKASFSLVFVIISFFSFGPIKVEAKSIYNHSFSWGSGKTIALKDKLQLLSKNRIDDIKLPVLLDVSLNSLTNSWGDKRSGGRHHEGIDIMAPRGSFIVSPTEAVVTRIDSNLLGGKVVYTANPGNETFYYAHLDGYNPELKVGDLIEPGDLIGYVGNSGDAIFGATHLHFTIYDDIKGPRNPYLRIHSEFSYDEKAKSLKKIIALMDSSDTKYGEVKNKYKDLVALAKTETISKPQVLGVKTEDKVENSAIGTVAYANENTDETNLEITKTKVEEKNNEVKVSKITIKRDLKLGDTGKDVEVLQKFLIKQAKGGEAKKLANVTSYGKFGPTTEKALIEYQKSIGISPAKGIFGPKTRAYLVNKGLMNK